jgi:hypothetical protein
MQTDNLELKKLVYLYLMNYAKSQPDMAIMAVNTFVKVIILDNLCRKLNFFNIVISQWEMCQCMKCVVTRLLLIISYVSSSHAP